MSSRVFLWVWEEKLLFWREMEDEVKNDGHRSNVKEVMTLF